MPSADVPVFVESETGLNVLAAVRNSVHEWAIASTGVFETYNGGNAALYRAALTEQGSEGVYVGTVKVDLADCPGIFYLKFEDDGGNLLGTGGIILDAAGVEITDSTLRTAIAGVQADTDALQTAVALLATAAAVANLDSDVALVAAAVDAIDTTDILKLARADRTAELNDDEEYEFVWYEEDTDTVLMRKAANKLDGTPVTSTANTVGQMIAAEEP